MTAIYLVPHIHEARVGLVQVADAILVRSYCCNYDLLENDFPLNYKKDLYYCANCKENYAARYDRRGSMLGTRISVRTDLERLQEWVSCWLGEEAEVQVF